jgi:hypothetical protein
LFVKKKRLFKKSKIKEDLSEREEYFKRKGNIYQEREEFFSKD